MPESQSSELAYSQSLRLNPNDGLRRRSTPSSSRSPRYPQSETTRDHLGKNYLEYGSFLIDLDQITEIAKQVYSFLPPTRLKGRDISKYAAAEVAPFAHPFDISLNTKESILNQFNPYPYMRMFQEKTGIYIGFTDKEKGRRSLNISQQTKQPPFEGIINKLSSVHQEIQDKFVAAIHGHASYWFARKMGVTEQPLEKFKGKLKSKRYTDYFQAVHDKYDDLKNRFGKDHANAFARKRLANYAHIVETAIKAELSATIAHEYSHRRELPLSVGLVTAAFASPALILEGANKLFPMLGGQALGTFEAQIIHQGIDLLAQASFLIVLMGGNIATGNISEYFANKLGTKNYPRFSDAITIDKDKFWSGNGYKVMFDHLPINQRRGYRSRFPK